MGFDIMINFTVPYLSTNPREFWQRWHISLSTWLRDYLYIPLGGNKQGTGKTYKNLFVTMLLGGLWHGAQWTFVVWGAYQGGLLMVHRALSAFLARIPSFRNRLAAGFWFVVRVLFFFHLICLGWLIFRADTLSQAGLMLKALLFDFRMPPGYHPGEMAFRLLFYVGVLMALQVLEFRSRSPEEAFHKLPCALRLLLCLVLFYALVIFGVADAKYFIYFQF
jgi:D-alanyl-lipoteichoic acid acyltransferase DltB (MBOAT superfamily)